MVKDSPSRLTWVSWAPGVEVASLPIYNKNHQGNLLLIRINPRLHDFDVLSAKYLQRPPQSFASWAREFKLNLVFNAGMYQKDGLSPTGYLKIHGKDVHPFHHPRYRAYLGLHPDEPDLPPVVWFDPSCDRMNPLDHYQTIVQNYRVYDCDGRVLWPPNGLKSSLLLLAIDAQENLIVVHSDLAISVYELATQLKSLPLQIQRAMYLEGGREAGVFLSFRNQHLEQYGRIQGTPVVGDQTGRIPNIIGVRFSEKGAQ